MTERVKAGVLLSHIDEILRREQWQYLYHLNPLKTTFWTFEIILRSIEAQPAGDQPS